MYTTNLVKIIGGLFFNGKNATKLLDYLCVSVAQFLPYFYPGFDRGFLTYFLTAYTPDIFFTYFHFIFENRN